MKGFISKAQQKVNISFFTIYILENWFRFQAGSRRGSAISVTQSTNFFLVNFFIVDIWYGLVYALLSFQLKTWVWVPFTQKFELQGVEKRFWADISHVVFSIQNLSNFHSQTSGSWKQTRVGYFAQTQGASEGDGWDGQGIQYGLWFYINHVCWLTLKIKVDLWNEKMWKIAILFIVKK